MAKRKSNYRKQADRDNARKRTLRATGRDIAADFPGPGDLARRAACAQDLERFLSTYFSRVFFRPWSADHKRIIRRTEAAILTGGLFALAMPRGSGKTSLAIRSGLWALLYGHKRYLSLVTATEADGERLLEGLKTELLYNEELAADFRSVVYPLRRLDGDARRASGQLFGGQRTAIVWASRRLSFPLMPDDGDGPNVSGAFVSVCGLTGALRGQARALPDGTVTRPDLVLLDDPQTRKSARSPAQKSERKATVLADVLGMAGPGQALTAVMPCTVIAPDDLADELLDRKRHPEWHGERTRLIYSFPTAEKEWEVYFTLRREAMQEDRPPVEAEAFYRDHQATMDAGAVVAWPERKLDSELSAIQHCLNVRCDLGDEAFFAEYQNEPLRPEADGGPVLEAKHVAAKVNRLAQGVVPVRSAVLTAGIDLGDRLLHWVVTAWTPDFGGSIISYGVFPEQSTRNFTSAKAGRTLADLSPGAAREGQVHAGLLALTDSLLSREWKREDGGVSRIGLALVDSGFLPDIAHEVCRRSPHAATLLPSRGLGIGPAGRPMEEWTPKPGEQRGFHWIKARSPDRAGQHVRADVNFWKSFLRDRFLTALGDRTSLSLYGSQPAEHELYAAHATAEYSTLLTGNGRTVETWLHRPARPDNHWWDATVLTCVAGSILGTKLPGMGPTATAKPRTATRADYDAKRRAFEAKRGY
jgi:hypothetical protein